MQDLRQYRWRLWLDDDFAWRSAAKKGPAGTEPRCPRMTRRACGRVSKIRVPEARPRCRCTLRGATNHDGRLIWFHAWNALRARARVRMGPHDRTSAEEQEVRVVTRAIRIRTGAIARFTRQAHNHRDVRRPKDRRPLWKTCA